MNGLVIGDVCFINAVEPSVSYKVSLAGSVFAYDPSKDAAESGLLFEIKGTVYKSEGASSQVFTELTQGMLTIEVYRSDGTKNLAPGNTVHVSGGTFSCSYIDGDDYNGESSCKVILTIGGKEADSASIQITKYGPAGAADVIVSQETRYRRTATSELPENEELKREAPWWTSRFSPTSEYPYVWSCQWTQWSVSGWKAGTPVILEKYLPQIRIISQKEWTEWALDINNTAASIYKGQAGEPYRDLFLDAGTGSFYECIRSATFQDATALGDAHPVSGSNKATYWKAGNYWSSFGTSLLAALSAYIDDLVVRKLETVRTSDGLSLTIEDGMITVNHRGTGQKALFGISNKGNLTLQFWEGDTLLVGFGPDEIMEQYNTKASAYTKVFWDYSGTDRASKHKFPIPTTYGTYWRFVEGYTRVGQSSATYALQYNVSKGNTPSVFSGKILKSNYTDATLKNCLANNLDPKTYIVADGYYARGFDTPVNGGANFECVQHHIVNGVIVETVIIGYKKVSNYGMPIYTKNESSQAYPVE